MTLIQNILLFSFTVSFHLRSDFDKPYAGQCKHHQRALDNRMIVTEKIRKEIYKCRYIGPFEQPPFSKFKCSSLGLIPKREECKFRRIHDLYYPKGYYVHYAKWIHRYILWTHWNSDSFISVNGHIYCLMPKSEIKDAFKLSDFPTFRFWAFLMGVIPEARCAY